MYEFCPVLLHQVSASTLASDLSVDWKWFATHSGRSDVADASLSLNVKALLRIHFVTVFYKCHASKETLVPSIDW